MQTRRTWIVLSLSTVIILLVTAFSVPARGVVRSGQPGGFFSLPWGTFVDPTAGGEHSLVLIARESEDTAGLGQATIQILGPSVSVCSIHGGDVNIEPLGDGENFDGSFPLESIQCGTAYSQAVSVEGCTLTVEMHGFSHSDYPSIIYSGPDTIQLTFRKTAADRGKFDITLFTPMGPIRRSGEVIGEVEMDTCP